MALSVLREETHQDKRRKRGRPSTDNGLMFRRVVRILRCVHRRVCRLPFGRRARCGSVAPALQPFSAEEQAEWQMTLQRVATAYRNWRRVSEAPGAVLGGLKSVGVSRPGGSN